MLSFRFALLPSSSYSQLQHRWLTIPELNSQAQSRPDKAEGLQPSNGTGGDTKGAHMVTGLTLTLFRLQHEEPYSHV